MTKIFLVAHQTRSEIRGLIAEIVAWSKAGRHEVWMASQDANALGWSDLASDRAAAEADLVLSLGGDGTVLRAVHELDGAAVPVLGVNVGTLGYLTEVEPAQCLANDGSRHLDAVKRRAANDVASTERSGFGKAAERSHHLA
jgi:NAD+ kinase